jgi:hypothetical protein
MTTARKLEWLMIALTACLLIALKQLHYGVTHYNIFLMILFAWTMILIAAFRALKKSGSNTINQDKS